MGNRKFKQFERYKPTADTELLGQLFRWIPPEELEEFLVRSGGLEHDEAKRFVEDCVTHLAIVHYERHGQNEQNGRKR